jgi:D-3-phosphoglycerate dehydrogenase
VTYKILITDNLSPQGLARLESAEDIEFDIITGLSPEDFVKTIPPYDGLIIRSSVKVTKDVLAAATNLKAIGRAGVGVDNVDVDEASMRGVIVMNTPGANTMATAEHTLALLLAMCRNVGQAYSSLKDGKWDRKKYMGTQLYRKTIGIIGMGRIGARVALRCQAFGMTTITYDPYLAEEVAEELGVERVELSDLFARADFISLHAASTPETKHIINAETIAQMKDSVRIVNTARGALIDEAALVEGLKSGKIAAAALDVFPEEPMPDDSPLRELDNVTITPHLAASTVEAQRDVSTQIVDQMLDVLHETDFRNVINFPLVDASVLGTLRPYLNLAEKIGSLHTQLADGAIERLEISISGDEIVDHAKPITVAILKGILDPILEQTVNYINAPHLAKRRGITISQTAGLSHADYPNLISCRAEWNGSSHTISGTLFSHKEPRIVQFDNYRIDVKPEGIILVVSNHDRPGFIGTVGSILGQHDINISVWRYGRDKSFGQAISFIGVDTDAPENVIETLRNLELVLNIKKVRL